MTTQPSETAQPPENAFENYDLRAQAEAARDPAVRFAFEFPDLLARFRTIDKVAMAAKTASRRSGFLSVGLVLSALLLASAQPVMPEMSHEAHVLIGYLSTGVGLLGAALGFLGLRKTAARRRWLKARLQTEVMRLFHFHYIAARLPELAMVKGDPQRQAAYLARRDQAFRQLLEDHLKDPERELVRLSNREDALALDPLVGEMAPTGEEDPQAMEQAFAVWRTLRFDWQLGYCDAKLAHKATSGKASSVQVERRFSTVAWICLGIVILLHVSQVPAEALHLPRAAMEVAIVWVALTALALRALEDGLQPQREVERYEQYRANILSSRERLEAAGSLESRLEVIRAFERTSLEEMRVFMRTHARSRFLL